MPDSESGRVESVKDRRKRLVKQTCLVALASLGHLAIGSNITFPSVAVSDLERCNTTITGGQLALTDTEKDMMGSLVSLGSLPGAWLAGILMAVIGRRYSMILSGVVCFASWVGVALLPTPTSLLVARAVAGIASGSMSVAGNTYAVEMADVEIRGAMALIPTVTLMLGQVLTVVVGYVARYYVVALVCSAIPLAYVVAMVLLPESPAFLAVKGHEKRARKTLLRLRGEHADVDAEIEGFRDDAGAEGGSLWRGLLKADVARALGAVCGLFLVQAFTGTEVWWRGEEGRRGRRKGEGAGRGGGSLHGWVGTGGEEEVGEGGGEEREGGGRGGEGKEVGREEEEAGSSSPYSPFISVPLPPYSPIYHFLSPLIPPFISSSSSLFPHSSISLPPYSPIHQFLLAGYFVFTVNASFYIPIISSSPLFPHSSVPLPPLFPSSVPLLLDSPIHQFLLPPPRRLLRVHGERLFLHSYYFLFPLIPPFISSSSSLFPHLSLPLFPYSPIHQFLLAGYFVFTVNASRFFKEAGSSVDEDLAAIIVMVVQFLVKIIASLLMDRIGRRMSLFVSFAMMVPFLIVMSVYVGLTDSDVSGRTLRPAFHPLAWARRGSAGADEVLAGGGLGAAGEAGAGRGERGAGGGGRPQPLRVGPPGGHDAVPRRVILRRESRASYSGQRVLPDVGSVPGEQHMHFYKYDGQFRGAASLHSDAGRTHASWDVWILRRCVCDWNPLYLLLQGKRRGSR
ncbi:putative sugar transporter protein 5 [Penaeus vannamei]|uniref:Putative sugar transporter protein 5 n=1 Tax=Penaeus vannamei TaxID=6689 RepID=A0A3R7M2K4_PENVA|nr:putative sugar transporter protein 5 [Penaeus vannamei]